MNKEEIISILKNHLKQSLNDENLINAIVENIMTSYHDDCSSFHAFRFLKRQTDLIWKAVKGLSERCLVMERAKAIKKTLEEIRPLDASQTAKWNMQTGKFKK